MYSKQNWGNVLGGLQLPESPACPAWRGAFQWPCWQGNRDSFRLKNNNSLAQTLMVRVGRGCPLCLGCFEARTVVVMSSPVFPLWENQPPPSPSSQGGPCAALASPKGWASPLGCFRGRLFGCEGRSCRGVRADFLSKPSSEKLSLSEGLPE